jgi:hypothetical protein
MRFSDWHDVCISHFQRCAFCPTPHLIALITFGKTTNYAARGIFSALLWISPRLVRNALLSISFTNTFLIDPKASKRHPNGSNPAFFCLELIIPKEVNRRHAVKPEQTITGGM